MTTDYQTPILVRIPQAPAQYTDANFNNIIRIIEENFRLLQNIGLLRGNGIYLIEPARDGNGLRIGEVYVDDGGFLRMVQEGDVFSGSVAGTGGVGTLTVLTP